MSSRCQRPELSCDGISSLPQELQRPEAWDFLVNDLPEPLPEPGDFWWEDVPDDCEDWLERF